MFIPNRRAPAALRTAAFAAFAALAAVSALAAASPARADRSDISQGLERRAVAACRGDALRLCPGHLSSRVAAARCIAAHRPKLTPACRRASDAVGRALRR